MHENALEWQKIICAPWFRFHSGGSLRIIVTIIIVLTQKCTKRLVNICVKFWQNVDRGQSMHK